MKDSIIEIFARHRVAANLLMIAMIISGLWAILQINTQILPNIDVNFVTVTIVWPGANAEDVERSITIPVEEELRNVDNLKKMTSKSISGSSIVILEFNTDTDMSEAFNEVNQAVSTIRNLPVNSEPPIVKRIMDYEPVANLLVTGTMGLTELRPLTYQFERELLDRGIAKINIVGLPKQEITIEVPAIKLAELNLSLNQIADIIAKQSADIPAGIVGKQELRKELRSPGKQRTIDGFANLPIRADNEGNLIRLGDIAHISRRARDQEILVFSKGVPAVEMTLLRNRATSALTSAKVLHQWLTSVRKTLPQTVKIEPYFENWHRIKERINLMLKNAVYGLILILIMLFLFLNMRIAVWVAAGIPASFLLAIFVLHLFGRTINMISLFGMIMTLGIIVDDSIVVGEEILSQVHQGKSIFNAVKTGAHFMFTPVMASSITTIATFLPLMLISGIIGQVLIDIPMFVICIIIAALVECFLVLPGHIYHSSHNKPYKEPIMQPYFEKFRDNYFRPFVKFAITHRWSTLSISFALVVITAALLINGYVKFNFFPVPEGTKIYADVHFSAGTPPRKVKHFLQQLEQSLATTNQQFKKQGENIVKTSLSFLNRSTTTREGSSNNGEQYASMNVELVSPEERKITNQQFMDQWRKNVKLPTGIENFTITVPRTGPPGRDIDIELSGADLHKLKAAAIELKQNLASIPGVSNVADDLPFGKEHLIYKLNAQGHALGLTTTDIGMQLRAAFQGAIAQIFHEPNDEIEVRVQLPDDERYRTASILQLPIVTPSGTTVPLGSIASLESKRGFDELLHSNNKLTVRVTADVNPAINTNNSVLAILQPGIISKLQQQYQLQITYAGRAEEQATTFKDMLIGLILALILVYLVLAWVFSSYLWPIAVMIAIPMGLVGAIWGHIIMHINLTLLSLFGFFGLSGIVVNDSIILLNRYGQLRANGLPFNKAIVEASCQRLRAVGLTSFTTIAGLLPLLFETSLQAQFLIPMAVSITFGLLVATVLILVIIPCLLYIFEEHFRHSSRTQNLSL